MASPRPIAPGGTDSTWLSLGPASRLLGVDGDTLRRWADTGRIRAFQTPGGHRRFHRPDLERLAATRRRGADGRPGLHASSDRLSRAFARAYAGGRAAPPLPDLSREAFRADGRRLVEVLLADLESTRVDERSRHEAEALALIEATAERLVQARIPLANGIEIFLRARQPILGELATLARRSSLDARQLADLYDREVRVLDRLLLHLIDHHAVVTAAKRRRSAT